MLAPWRLMENLSCPEVVVGCCLGCIPVRTGLVERDLVGQEAVLAGCLEAWTPGCS